MSQLFRFQQSVVQAAGDGKMGTKHDGKELYVTFRGRLPVPVDSVQVEHGLELAIRK